MVRAPRDHAAPSLGRSYTVRDGAIIVSGRAPAAAGHAVRHHEASFGTQRSWVNPSSRVFSVIFRGGRERVGYEREGRSIPVAHNQSDCSDVGVEVGEVVFVKFGG